MSIWKRKFRTEMGHQKTQCGGDKRTSPTPFLSLNLAQDCSKKNFFFKCDKSENVQKVWKHNIRAEKKKRWSSALQHYLQEPGHRNNLIIHQRMNE